MNHNRDEAYALGMDPHAHRAYYDEWAATYDEDFAAASRYVYPRQVASVLARHLTDADDPVLDLACGTGLLGRAFREVSDLTIVGTDVSPNSLDMARAHHSYARLIEADLTDAPSEPGAYGALVSCGSFTLGHLGPRDLMTCLDWGRPGALSVIGINLRHFLDAGFELTLTQARSSGRIGDVTYVDVPIYASAPGSAIPEDVDPVSVGRVAVFRLA